jgi:hypothetical protein
MARRRRLNTYITYDLDTLVSKNANKNKHMQFVHKLLTLDVDKIAVIAHHRIIPQIKDLKPDIIYNVDFHSDICIGKNLGKKNLNCGVWANYVEAERFTWVHPHTNRYQMDEGYCHIRTHYNPFKVNITPFDKISHSNTFPSLKGVIGASICLSPVYGGDVDLFYELVDQYKLSIIEKRGDWNAR